MSGCREMGINCLSRSRGLMRRCEKRVRSGKWKTEKLGARFLGAPTADGRRDARLGAGFVDDVEGGFGGAAETGEARGGDDVADARFSRLRPKTEADFLRARAG